MVYLSKDSPIPLRWNTFIGIGVPTFLEALAFMSFCDLLLGAHVFLGRVQGAGLRVKIPTILPR
jgi:hypothetical protein